MKQVVFISFRQSKIKIYFQERKKRLFYKTFFSGEELKMKHKADGVNSNRTLLVEIEVVGEVPLLEPHSSVIVKPIEQDFIQTGTRRLYALSQNNLTVEGRNLPFSWNSSIHYDSQKESMPCVLFLQ